MIARRKTHILSSDFFRAVKSLVKKDINSASWVREWERTFADFIGTKYALATSSGRKALELILCCLKLNPQDEVLLPAYTLKDLIPVIQKLKLTPVPVDIETDSFNLSLLDLEHKISKRTKVIIATHIFGGPCQIDKILSIAKNNALFVIEDCAHSAGAVYQGKTTGSFGNASFFSFESMKPVNTYGGGMILTDDTTMVERLRQMTAGYKKTDSVPFKKMVVALTESILFSTPFVWPFLYLLSSRRLNAKLARLYRLVQKPPGPDAAFGVFQARIGLEKIKTLSARIKKRQTAADFLKGLLDSRFKPQAVNAGSSHNYYFFVVLVPQDVWRVRRFLLRRGIDAGIASEVTDNCGKMLGQDCPGANEVFNRAIQLPLYEGLSEQKIRRIARALNEALA
jgi:dTDP-4-amino-4,6-dideoxygalactose transaminase